ncbi:MAG: thiamine phosphate synthase [Holophagaceae bacterium]
MHLLVLTPGRGFDAAAWARVLEAGVDGFLIREPQLEARALLDAARWCRALAPGVELWVRGRLDVALAADAGLHAPEGHPDLPPGRVRLSRPLHEPAQAASRSGADQLLVSPVFAVPGKGRPWGVHALHAFLDGLPSPAPRLLALGGVEASNAAALKHPRLDGLAVIRALWDAPDPAAAAAELRAAWA